MKGGDDQLRRCTIRYRPRTFDCHCYVFCFLQLSSGGRGFVEHEEGRGEHDRRQDQLCDMKRSMQPDLLAADLVCQLFLGRGDVVRIGLRVDLV